jgi:menaquinone-dependent protoporphyrinogen IX oxidase
LVDGRRLPGGLQPLVDRIHPRDIAVFHGKVSPGKLNFFEKWILNKVQAESGDFRDWDAIAGWAASIVKVLPKAGFAASWEE